MRSLNNFDREEPSAPLVEHGDLYRNHLVIAHWIDGLVPRNRQDFIPDEEGTEAWNRALWRWRRTFC